MRVRDWETSLWLALFISGASLGVLGWGVHRAIDLQPIAAVQTGMSARSLTVVPAASGASGAHLSVAIEKDPFLPDRHRPAVRFRLPGESIEDEPGAGLTPASAVRLIGTAVLAGGNGFAMCQFGNQRPKLVRVGERVGDLTLRKVEQGLAVFVAADGKPTEFHVPKSGS